MNVPTMRAVVSHHKLSDMSSKKFFMPYTQRSREAAAARTGLLSAVSAKSRMVWGQAQHEICSCSQVKNKTIVFSPPTLLASQAMLNLGTGWFAPCDRILWTSCWTKVCLARRGASAVLALMFVVHAAAPGKLFANEIKAGVPPEEAVSNKTFMAVGSIRRFFLGPRSGRLPAANGFVCKVGHRSDKC